ncbi:MAG: CheY-like chemotaxis protein [Lentimonas sp.]|jgi:CheY-like chemotaxis protein
MSKVAGRSILILENNIDELHRLTVEAQEHGMRVFSYSDSQPVCDLLAAGEIPDVMLIDHDLPGGDAVKLAQRVSKWNSKKPVLLLMSSIQGDSEVVPPGLFEFILIKPLERRVLKGLIHNALLSNDELRVELNSKSVDELGPVLNLQMIEEFLFDQETYEMIVEGFGVIINEHGDQIKAAIEQDQILVVRSHLHALIGSTGNVGLKKLYEYYRTVQSRIHKFGEMPNPNFVDEATKICKQSLAALKAHGIVRASFEW